MNTETNVNELSPKSFNNVLQDTLNRYEHVKSTLDDVSRASAYTVENVAEIRKGVDAVNSKIDAAFAQIGVQIETPKGPIGKALAGAERVIDKATPALKVAAVAAGLGYAGFKGFQSFKTWRANRAAEAMEG